MIMHRIVELSWIVLLIQFVSKQVAGDPHRDLAILSRSFYTWRLEDSPEFATHLGVYKYNDRLESFTLRKQQTRKLKVEGFMRYLRSLNTTGMSKSDWINYQILEDTMQTFLDGYEWRLYGGLNPLSFLEGNHIDPYVEVGATPFDTQGDYENYIVRLEKRPKQLADYEVMFREAIRLKHTFHNVSVIKVPEQIDRIISRSVEQSSYYIPFTYVRHTLREASHTAVASLQKRAATAIRNVMEAYRKLKTFLERVYLPRTRPQWGVGAWPKGPDYYKACLKWHLSTDMTPEEVHEIGKKEVKRIANRMQEILGQHGFTGSFTEFFNQLRTDPRFHNNTAEELLKEYQSIIKDRIEPKLPELFKNIPNMPLNVARMPNDGPGGQYMSGSEDGLRAGVFLVNLERPNET